MAKWITLATVAGLFFSAGIFAGHSVPSTTALATGVIEKSNSDRATDQKSASGISMDSTSENESLPIELISHSATNENSEFRTVELMAEAVSTDEADEQSKAIRNLIQQHFPDTDAVAAEIWVETFAEMSLDEIAFVLEQKRLTSKGIGASLPGSLMPSMPSLTDTVLARSLRSGPAPVGDIAVKAVETNLRSAYSLGFRRTVVLPDAIADLESWTPDKPRSVHVTSFRSFEYGTLIASPIATHVALTKEDSTMLCLEGDRLTRRGDFQLLADRRLGIVTRCEEIASAASTPLPEGATDIRILRDGKIQFKSAAGETGEAGRIAVCSVNDLANLQSDDGVFFTATDDDCIITHKDASAFLLTHRLEQSNVDRSYESSLLTHLKSLNDPTMEQDPQTLRQKQ